MRNIRPISFSAVGVRFVFRTFITLLLLQWLDQLLFLKTDAFALRVNNYLPKRLGKDNTNCNSRCQKISCIRRSGSSTSSVVNTFISNHGSIRLYGSASDSSSSIVRFSVRRSNQELLLTALRGMIYLLLPSSVGLYSNLLLEKILHLTSSSNGLIITLLTAATLSNLGFIPSSHPVFDVTWKIFLPASLAFLLIGSNTATTNPQNDEAITATSNHNITWIKLCTVGVAFTLASIGSILGCTVSFLLEYLILSISNKNSPWIWTTLLFPSGKLAALAAGCLCASYIGGSVNFFSTAQYFLQNYNSMNNLDSNNLLTSMAAADLIVMAFYFIMLSTIQQNQRIASWYSNNNNNDGKFYKSNSTVTTFAILSSTSSSSSVGEITDTYDTLFSKKDQLSVTINRTSTLTKAVCCILLLLVTSSLVQISHATEIYTRLPGSSTVSITALASIISLLLENSKLPTCWITTIRTQSLQLSSICFHLFFASLGYSANVVQAAPLYGPASLLFGSVALLFHIVVTFVGCWIWNQLLLLLFTQKLSWKTKTGTHDTKKDETTLLTLEDILVASNAAIGGPATAASFAGSFTHISDAVRNALIIAGTFYGVFGYAIGTSIGVSLTRILLGFTK